MIPHLALGMLALAAPDRVVVASAPAAVSASAPIYEFRFVSRTMPAVNYKTDGSDTRLGFRGTPLAPNAGGKAEVEAKDKVMVVESKFDHLPAPGRIGSEHAAYVLWAVTPEGQAQNLGEVRWRDGDGDLVATTELQAFGLMVTAEPHFAVTRPSNAVVLENVLTHDTDGKVRAVDARVELLERGQYDTILAGGPRIKGDRRELKQARNAVAIARAWGADRHAGDVLGKAERLLAEAGQRLGDDHDSKRGIMAAREAVQTAEEARVIAEKGIEAERLAREQEAAAEARARAGAAEASAALADAERLKAEAARDEADRLRLKAEEDKAALRARLLEQLQVVLEARDTARGLLVNISDVLFDVDQATLRPGAREKLARVGGILVAHPGLRVEVEGHTDSDHTAEYNQQLSERRAIAVRDYLIAQGVPAGDISARGFGETLPVASNATAAGKQQNRRVELIVSGDIIGERVGVVSSVEPGLR